MVVMLFKELNINNSQIDFPKKCQIKKANIEFYEFILIHILTKTNNNLKTIM